ncbi:type VI secretion system protein VasI [Gemmobacter megaterium]|uniref:Type VI secretion system protein VasI n=2 Tax=Gemmobacter megaterium TaxID=1086013 RepID=A0A1N7QJE6_9RHOB|nr:type VI secretion system protein VasI [Gemmobacter megaterium]
MTDTMSHWVAANSESAVKCNDHSRAKPMVMMISCYENTTSITIEGEGCFFSKYWGKVEYRLDDQPMKTVRMTESNDNRALGLWSGKQSIPFVKSLLGATKIRLRILPVNEDSIETTFNLTGLSDALAPVRKACGW